MTYFDYAMRQVLSGLVKAGAMRVMPSLHRPVLPKQRLMVEFSAPGRELDGGAISTELKFSSPTLRPRWSKSAQICPSFCEFDGDHHY